MIMFSPVILCVFLFFQHISSSAIPVWELLSKQEKMSYLYSMFANQVEEFCEFSENRNCNQDLLKYGLKKLKAMPEDILDSLDPYQRGAGHIIWDSMMEGHSLMSTTPKTRETTTAKPNSYDDDLSFGVDDFGSQGAASAKISNVYRVPPPKGFVYNKAPSTLRPAYNIRSGQPEYKHALGGSLQNELSLENTLFKSTSGSSGKHFAPYGQEIPLTGPLVVKVYPDGTPVKDEPQNLPQDEDLKQYQLSQIRLPSV